MPSKHKMKELLKNILLSVLSLFVFFLFLELCFRGIESLQKKQEVWKDRPLFYYTPSDSASLRSIQENKDLPKDTFKILVIGDSFSFAPYMQFDDTFSKRLERMLNLEGKRKVIVTNLGVPGYSTSHEAIDLKNYLKTNKVDYVLWQITLNDPERKILKPSGMSVLVNQYSTFDSDSWQNPFLKKFHILGFIAARIHNYLVAEEYKNYYLKLYSDEIGMNFFFKSMNKIKAICAKHNLPVSSVIFPLFGYSLDSKYPFLQIHELIKNKLSELNIPVLDLFNSFKGASAERLTVLPGEDFHPNEIAHRIAAEEIYSWWVREKFIPEDIIAKSIFAERTQVKLERAKPLEPLNPPSRN